VQRASLLLAVIAIGAALDGGCAPSIQGKSPGLAQQSRPLSTAPRFPSAADPNYATTYDKYRQDYHKSNVVAPALGYDDPGLTGKVQPTEAELEVKKTFLEDNSQHPRKIAIS